MKVTPTDIPDVLVVEPDVFEDSRGFFFESYREERFRAAGIQARFVQDNHSHSVRHTLRGLHFQLEHPQAKLCRVASGEVLDVAVDIRAGSPTFGRWVGVTLSAENRRQLFVPRGFAHGFLVLSATADFLYKCDEVYHPEDDRGILWRDPGLGIRWEVSEPIVSAKDARLPALADLGPEQLPRYEAGKSNPK